MAVRLILNYGIINAKPNRKNNNQEDPHMRTEDLGCDITSIAYLFALCRGVG